MKCASIDIGTNTLRLLVAEFTGAGTLKPKLARRFITRLGGGFTEDKGIDEASAKRAFLALDEIKLTLDDERPEFVDAVATSVVRNAVNSSWFVDNAAGRLGSRIRVIEGEEEARLSLLGVASVLGSDADAGADKKKLVMDIGGGSTEFIFACGDKIEAAISLDLGVVHLTEKFLRSDPPGNNELNELVKAILMVVAELKDRALAASIDLNNFSPAGDTLFIGTAGTVTTLSALNLALSEYDPDIINGSILSRAEVEGLLNRLKDLTMKERLEYVALEEGREDLIISGILIVLLVMRAFGFEEMTVSDAGLLEGIILDSHR